MKFNYNININKRVDWRSEMELDFLRMFFTLLNIALIILIAYVVVKIVRHIIKSFNRLERIENKLNEI